MAREQDATLFFLRTLASSRETFFLPSTLNRLIHNARKKGESVMSLVEKHLVAPTTYHDYTNRWLGPVADLPKALQNRYTQLEAKITSKLKDGDELWEWNTSGEDVDRGTSGLAIVREGKVIESWVCWTS